MQLVSHILGSRPSERETVTTEQVRLGIRVRGSTVGWYGTWDFLLVTACCDNSGVSGVMT